MVVLSKRQEEYFNELEQRINQIYDIAKEAKSRGLDPSTDVESPIAKDLAGRVETLIGPKGIAKRIRELKENGLNEDEIVFEIATEILDKKLGNIESKDERVDRAIRAALAIKTQGVVSAPLEGISRILIRKDNLGNSYLSLYFAGPIRAAGGTTTALCILLADMVRKKINLAKYKATEGEIGRMVEEIKLYNR
ncbi:MAG: DNA polymerase II large subunit, partial [Candidatus Lokiarchaeota archaeon]|nr:DNA polymerase II large subunit [Candidatus Lokiarchaeota archaeon]